MAEFTFEIVDHIGTIAEHPNGWTKEVNLVSFCHAEPKIDIRDWSPDHEKMSKGISFTAEEAKSLCAILHDYVKGETR